MGVEVGVGDDVGATVGATVGVAVGVGVGEGTGVNVGATVGATVEADVDGGVAVAVASGVSWPHALSRNATAATQNKRGKVDLRIGTFWPKCSQTSIAGSSMKQPPSKWNSYLQDNAEGKGEKSSRKGT
jgi:hypothetical protein